MKARKKKNVRARLSKRYARIVKDARGCHDYYSWAKFNSSEIRVAFVSDMDRVTSRLLEVCERFGLNMEFVGDES